MSDLIERQAAIDIVRNRVKRFTTACVLAVTEIEQLPPAEPEKRTEKHTETHACDLPSAQPDNSKYEYHYDHTDCIWYRPEARNRCPSTCAQYRDGWNDAMNYIFRDGEGYRPYRRDKTYE